MGSMRVWVAWAGCVGRVRGCVGGRGAWVACVGRVHGVRGRAASVGGVGWVAARGVGGQRVVCMGEVRDKVVRENF